MQEDKEVEVGKQARIQNAGRQGGHSDFLDFLDSLDFLAAKRHPR